MRTLQGRFVATACSSRTIVQRMVVKHPHERYSVKIKMSNKHDKNIEGRCCTKRAFAHCSKTVGLYRTFLRWAEAISKKRYRITDLIATGPS